MDRDTDLARSYRGLPAEATRLFRALALHPGPDIGLPAAAAAAGVPVPAARRLLDVLLGASLIEAAGPRRYQLSGPQRAYALDQARAADSDADRQGVLDRVLRWYIAGACEAARSLVPGDCFPLDVPLPEGASPLAFGAPAAAFEWFDTERANMVASARAAMEAGLPRRAWELGVVLNPVHGAYFTFGDWDAHSAMAVAAAEAMVGAETTAGQTALAAALDTRGRFLFRRRRLQEARAVHTRVLALREELGDRQGTCRSLNALGLICLRTRDLAQAVAYFTDIAGRARQAGDAHWEGLGRANLTEAQLETGDPVPALATARSLPLFFASRGDSFNEGNTLWLLAWAQRLAGNLLAAREAIDQALRIADQSGNRACEAWWLVESARVHLAAGQPAEAMRCCQLAASLERQIGDHSREATALDCTGQVLRAQGNPVGAAAFHHQAARMHQHLGDPWQQALATLHLTDCQQDPAQASARRDNLTTALALLKQFPDNQAARLRAEIKQRLDPTH